MPFAPLLISFFFTFTFTPCVRMCSGDHPHLMSDAARRTSHIFQVSALDDLEENGPNSRLLLVQNKKNLAHPPRPSHQHHPPDTRLPFPLILYLRPSRSEWVGEKKYAKRKGRGMAGDTCLYAVVYLLHSFILSCLVFPLFTTTRTKRAQKVSDTSKDNEGREGGVQVYPHILFR